MSAAELHLDDDDTTVAGHTPTWLVDRAVALLKGIRDREPQKAVQRLTKDLTPTELRALAVTLAAMCRSDVDPERALEWVDLPPAQWSDATVVVEEGRYMSGARDWTATRGRGQWEFRRRKATAISTPTSTPEGPTS